MKNDPTQILGGCPIEATLGVIGGKWKAIIIYHLMMSTVRYNELERRLIEITPGMLTKQLRELEQDGVVHREVYPQVPPKVEYSLTEFGRTLVPIFKLMEAWGNQYILDLDNNSNLPSTKRVKKIKESMDSLDIDS